MEGRGEQDQRHWSFARKGGANTASFSLVFLYIDQLASTDITVHSVRCKHCEHCEHCEPAFEESLPLSISF